MGFQSLTTSYSADCEGVILFTEKTIHTTMHITLSIHKEAHKYTDITYELKFYISNVTFLNPYLVYNIGIGHLLNVFCLALFVAGERLYVFRINACNKIASFW